MHTIDPDISQTRIGRLYGWRRLSDADPARLIEDRKHALAVIEDPKWPYPEALLPSCRTLVTLIDAFMHEHGDTLRMFA